MWLLALALAAPSTGAEEVVVDEPEVEEPALEIIVHGELLVEQARRRVIEDLQGIGYSTAIRKDDHLLLRHVDPWKGEVRVYDDGWVMMKRQPVQIEGREMPWAPKNSALAWAGCVVWPWLCLRSGGQLVSERKLMGQKVRTLAPMDADIDEYGDRVADMHVDERASSLPDRLERLWYEGQSLNGSGVILLDVALRRASLLDFWDSRTDTPWGNQVRAVVEAFIREEVQDGPHAFTDADIAEFNERRHSEEVLDLSRAWDEVMADLDGPVRSLLPR
jgi:hypothetical protein